MWEPFTKAEAKRLYHALRPPAGATAAEVLIEGHKMLHEVLQYPERIRAVYATEPLPNLQLPARVTRYLLTAREAKSISSVEQFPGVACRVSLEYAAQVLPTQNCLYLYGIRDPGNAGTILRSADWYGVPQVVAADSVSLFNPKLVHASMGSALRVRVLRNITLQQLATTHHIYLADLDGTPVEQVQLRTPWVLVVGSESHGLGDLEITNASKITIPRVGPHIDSLNAAISCSIILDRFRTAEPSSV